MRKLEANTSQTKREKLFILLTIIQHHNNTMLFSFHKYTKIETAKRALLISAVNNILGREKQMQ